MLFKQTLSAALVAAALMASASAATTVSLRISEDDLHSHEGVERVYTELLLVSRSVCRDGGALGRSLRARRACQEETMQSLVEQIGSPRLAAYHGETFTLASRR